jgi:hypothetical protein
MYAGMKEIRKYVPTSLLSFSNFEIPDVTNTSSDLVKRSKPLSLSQSSLVINSARLELAMVSVWEHAECHTLCSPEI